LYSAYRQYSTTKRSDVSVTKYNTTNPNNKNFPELVAFYDSQQMR